MPTTLKVLLYATAVCVILFCVSGVAFMYQQRADVEVQQRVRFNECMMPFRGTTYEQDGWAASKCRSISR
jgi:hypothetical protein